MFLGFSSSKRFSSEEHQIPSWDDHKLLLLSPSGHIGTEKSSRDECEAKPAGELQAILQTALSSAEQGCSSKQHSQTAQKAQEPVLKLLSCPSFI